MMKWFIKSDYEKKKKWLAVLTDTKLCESCLNDLNIFNQYLLLVEDETLGDMSIPSLLQQRILWGIDHLNWEGYFD